MESSLPRPGSPRFEAAKVELEQIKTQYDMKEPDRGASLLDDACDIKWRTQKPDYTLANLSYLKGKTMNHAAGSIEELVENLVKTWEMEASHKTDYDQWTTINQEEYCVAANGGEIIEGKDAKEMGNYNWLFKACPANLWDSDKSDFDSSHHTFSTAFNEGFPWECLAVFSGPPAVVFSWRHWANFTGVYKCPQTGVDHHGEGELVEMFGLGRVTVDANLKICKIEIFYKPDEFLEVLQGVRDPGDLSQGNSLLGPGGQLTVLETKRNKDNRPKHVELTLGDGTTLTIKQGVKTSKRIRIAIKAAEEEEEEED